MTAVCEDSRWRGQYDSDYNRVFFCRVGNWPVRTSTMLRMFFSHVQNTHSATVSYSLCGQIIYRALRSVRITLSRYGRLQAVRFTQLRSNPRFGRQISPDSYVSVLRGHGWDGPRPKFNIRSWILFRPFVRQRIKNTRRPLTIDIWSQIAQAGMHSSGN